MKIKIVFELDDHARRWIAHYYGEKGKASREMCKSFIEDEAYATLEALADDYNAAQESDDNA